MGPSNLKRAGSRRMALFLDLLLGHMLGDFLLQPGKLVAAKRDGWRGLLLHTFVVGFATTMAALGTLSRDWLVVSGHARTYGGREDHAPRLPAHADARAVHAPVRPVAAHPDHRRRLGVRERRSAASGD